MSVIATETRPALQGARLTAFELKVDGFQVTLIADTAVGYMFSRGAASKAIVGADRILATGHVFNKIGTYQLAVLARRHGKPFFVAAPSSTFDLHSRPEDVVIEERGVEEVVEFAGRRVAPRGVKVRNPAFDMTPPELVSAIITEKGVLRPPYTKSIRKMFKGDA